MPFFYFIWIDEIIQHLAAHGVTQDELKKSFATLIELNEAGRATAMWLWDTRLRADISPACMR